MMGIVILVVCIILFIAYGYCSNFILTKSIVQLSVRSGQEQNAPTDKKQEIRFVLLADLHGALFGKENKKLLLAVREERPDGIFIAGDMVIKNGKGVFETLSLCRELVKICPVYYGLGNHEIRLTDREEFIDKLKKTGVILLDNEITTASFYGKKVQIAGLTLSEEYYEKFWREKILAVQKLEKLFPQKRERMPTILIAHNPEYFKTYAKWGADLVLSGHVHGGIMTLPFGGVISPSFRIFPKYTNGVYTEGSSKMVLSRGLGLHHIKLRFFNLPQIVTIVIPVEKL